VIAFGLALAVAPTMALAQATEPMLPVSPPPVAPNLPVEPVLPQRGLTVVERERPELSPLGVRFGDWFLYPRFEVDEAYNDNIFATSTAPTGSFISALLPSFDLRSNLPQNALELSAGAVISFYTKDANFNTQDAYGNLAGRLDVDAVHDFHGTLSAVQAHEDPGSPNVAGNFAAPLVYDTYAATVGFAQTRLRLGYSADLAAAHQTYQSVPLVGGGMASQSFQNNDAYEGALRAYYEVAPNYQAYVRGAYNQRIYPQIPAGQPTRDSAGFRADLGAHIDITGVTYGEVFVGYLQQYYRSSFYGNIGAVDLGANIVWNVTQLTSVTLKGGRTVEDTNSSVVGTAPSPGYLESAVVLRVDHELLRNLLLDVSASYVNDAFKGISRTDNYYLVGAGAKYLLNRYLYLSLDYIYEQRESSGSAAINPFARNIIMLRLSTQL
jgi:hypothetical protein